MAKKKLRSDLFTNYPLKDEHRSFFVKYPVQKDDGKWYAANVMLPTGYMIPVNAAAMDTEAECQKACDLHNQFHWWTKDEANAIIAKSMNNSSIKA